MIPVAIIALVVLAFVFLEARKAYWDGKVREMCEKEGGIKIFQRVDLPEEEFKKLLNDRKQIDLPNVNYARPDQIYVYSSESEYIGRGDLQIVKHVSRVLRRPEGAILSEKIIFSRVGGDFPIGIGHRTYFSCPPQSETLFDKTFSRLQ